MWKLNAAILTTVFFWASALVAIRIGLQGYHPGSLALLRFISASIAMLPLYIRLDQRHSATLKELIALLVLGIFGIGLYNLCLIHGEQTVPAGTAGFIIGLIPVATILLSIAFLKERVNWKVWLGVGISIIGMVLLSVGEHDGVQFNTGVLFVFAATLLGSGYTILQKPLLRKFNPIEVTAFAMWGSTLALLYFLPQLRHDIVHAPLHATLAGIYMGIFPAAIAYATWSYVVQHMPASHATTYLYMIPIVTTSMSYFVLGELPAWLSITGGLIALAGALLAKLAR